MPPASSGALPRPSSYAHRRQVPQEEITTCDMTLDDSEIHCNHTVYLISTKFYKLEDQIQFDFAVSLSVLCVSILLSAMLFTIKRKIRQRKQQLKQSKKPVLTSVETGVCLKGNLHRRRLQLVGIRMVLCFLVCCICVHMSVLLEGIWLSIGISALILTILAMFVPFWSIHFFGQHPLFGIISDICALPILIICFPVSMIITRVVKSRHRSITVESKHHQQTNGHLPNGPLTAERMPLRRKSNVSVSSKSPGHSPANTMASDSSDSGLSKSGKSYLKNLRAETIAVPLSTMKDRVNLVPEDCETNIDEIVKGSQNIIILTKENTSRDNWQPLSVLNTDVYNQNLQFHTQSVSQLCRNSELFQPITLVAANTPLQMLLQKFREDPNCLMWVTDTLVDNAGLLKSKGKRIGTLKVFVPAKGNDQLLGVFEGDTVVGRAKGQCHITINHTTLSKVHAIMSCSEEQVTLVDKCSINGTSVNTFTLQPDEPYTLQHGDIVCFGHVKCQFFYEPHASTSSNTSSTNIIGCLSLDVVLDTLIQSCS